MENADAAAVISAVFMIWFLGAMITLVIQIAVLEREPWEIAAMIIFWPIIAFVSLFKALFRLIKEFAND